MTNNHTISIDIGGTKTAIGIINDKYKLKAIKIKKTIKGIAEFPFFFNECLKTGVLMGCSEGILCNQMVYCGIPGNFSPGGEIVVNNGSGLQLIKNNEDFKENNLTDWILNEMNQKFEFLFINDALAQAIGGIYQVGINKFINKRVLYIGPGTGLGGALIDVGESINDLNVLSDGHIYDVMIKGDDGAEKMAEDMISGRALYEKSGVYPKEIAESDELWLKHEPCIQKMGDDLIQLLSVLTSGDFSKKNPNNNWGKEDQLLLKNIDIVLFGGSILNKGKMGKYYQKRFINEINMDIKFIKDPTEAALLGSTIYFQNNKV